MYIALQIVPMIMLVSRFTYGAFTLDVKSVFK
jgi:hypothetical protein